MRQLKRSVKNGFSLIEVLVGTAILACVLAVIGIFSQNVIGVVGQMEGTKVVADSVDLARLVLTSPDQCTLNLQNIPLSLSVPLGYEVNSISSYDLKTSLPTSLILKEGGNLSGITLQSIYLIPLKQIETGLLYSQLQFTFKLPGALTLQPIQRTLPLMVQLMQGKVTGCWLRNDGATIDADAACAQISGGGLNSYNKITGTCTLAGGKWFTGTSQTATCPAGTLLAPNANASYNCNYLMPATFQDPAAVAVQFSDGTSSTIGRPPAYMILNAPASTCTCAWATDISASDVATFNCQILCLAP